MAFLAGPEAPYVTGASLFVDGGLSLTGPQAGGRAPGRHLASGLTPPAYPESAAADRPVAPARPGATRRTVRGGSPLRGWSRPRRRCRRHRKRDRRRTHSHRAVTVPAHRQRSGVPVSAPGSSAADHPDQWRTSTRMIASSGGVSRYRG